MAQINGEPIWAKAQVDWVGKRKGSYINENQM